MTYSAQIGFPAHIIARGFMARLTDLQGLDDALTAGAR